MGIVNQIMAHFQGWTAYLSTDTGRVQAWPYLWLGCKVLLGLVVLLLLLYKFRAHQVRRERSIKYRISNLIAHLCDTYDCLEDVDLKEQIVYSYNFREGELQIEKTPLVHMQQLVGPLHPSDAVKYTDEMVKSLIEKAMKTCSQVEFTCREKQADGTYHWVSCLFQGIKKDKAHSRSCLLLKHQVDDMRTREMERRAQLNMDVHKAQELAQSRSRFMARINQDTREALEAIMGSLTLAEGEVNGEQRREFVKQGQEQVRYLLGLLEDITNLSAMEHGTLESTLEVFSIRKSLDRVFDLFKDEAARRQIQFETNIEAMLYPNLVGDRKHLEQVLINLLTNVLLFTEPHHMVQCAAHQTPGRDKKVNMEFTVLCVGMKVPEDMLDKVFLPFELSSQLGNGSLHRGLGLVVTHNMVHLMGGIIKADNAQGKGMRFTIELPFGYSHESVSSTPNP